MALKENYKRMTVRQILSEIKSICRDKSWRGHSFNKKGNHSIVRFVNGISLHYAYVFNISQEDVLNAMHARRYSIPNYYQECNFPRIHKSMPIFDTVEDFKKRFPSGKFRCPRCGGISTDPYECNSGKNMNPGKKCDWKSYGLFGCIGKGYSFIVREKFLESPGTNTIFKPIELENSNE